jgi:hypothetical protein
MALAEMGLSADGEVSGKSILSMPWKELRII